MLNYALRHEVISLYLINLYFMETCGEMGIKHRAFLTLASDGGGGYLYTEAFKFRNSVTDCIATTKSICLTVMIPHLRLQIRLDSFVLTCNSVWPSAYQSGRPALYLTIMLFILCI
jgi:hypothetical protein